MALPYVVTNSAKLKAFFKRGNKIENIEIRVGQLTGKPKYAPGHVGKKSRDKGRRGLGGILQSESNRRSQIRGLRRQLDGMPKEQRKAAVKAIRAELKKGGTSSKGLTTKRGGAVAVAKVAGILESGKTGGRPYHVISLERRSPELTRELDSLMRALIRGGNVARMLVTIGKNTKKAIRVGLRRSGHVDTGKMLRNTQFEIINAPGKKMTIAAAKRKRKAARFAKAQAKRNG